VQDIAPHRPSGESRHDAVVRVGPLMGLSVVLQELGHEPGPIFDSVGFKPAQFADPDTEISYVAGSRLLANCVAATECRHFGLLVGARAGPSCLGVAGFMLWSAADVGTALRGLVQHLELHDQGSVLTLLTRGDVTRLGFAIHQSSAKVTEQIYDLSIALICNIMRDLCGEEWNPTEVLLPRRQPQDLAPYRCFFRAPLRFNTEQCGVVFPTHWLDHRIASANALLHRHLEQEADELHGLRHADLIINLRGLLRKSLAAGHCTVSDIARALHIHERTLNRRLHEESTSFRKELDDVRLEMARQFLANSAMPIARIAKALNYADVSAFSRAFKRWTGKTPAQWRARGAISS
jgi:AraC-like DNA-binding protein